MYIYTCHGVCVGDRGQLTKSQFSLSTKFGQGNQTHVIRFGVKCLNPLDHLIKLTKKRLTWSLLQPCYIFGKRDCISLYF